MTKKAGSGSESGSISQKHGSEDPDPDPPQNVINPDTPVLTLSHLEYLSGGKVDSEGLRILLRGEDDCTRQVLAAAAFPVPLLKGTWQWGGLSGVFA